jgi:hypothetical protein
LNGIKSAFKEGIHIDLRFSPAFGSQDVQTELLLDQSRFNGLAEHRIRA